MVKRKRSERKTQKLKVLGDILAWEEVRGEDQTLFYLSEDQRFTIKATWYVGERGGDRRAYIPWDRRSRETAHFRSRRDAVKWCEDRLRYWVRDKDNGRSRRRFEVWENGRTDRVLAECENRKDANRIAAALRAALREVA